MVKKKTKTKGGGWAGDSQWGTHRTLRIDKIEISDRPNRHHIDQKTPEFLELVESVKSTGGILQPVLVRPHPAEVKKGRQGPECRRYELVAGERRLKASIAAGRRTISAMCRAMTDAEAGAFELTENVHRSDLLPLEEADQVRAMLDAGSTTAEIGKLLGRTQRWVQRRASLTGLSTVWQTAVSARATAFGLWPAAALEKIARLPEDLQEALFKSWSNTYRGRHLKTPAPEAADLDKAIGDVTHELKRARWKLDDATSVPKAGACSECRKRAGQQPLLWDTLSALDLSDPKAQKQDVCLDTKCWGKKAAAYIKTKVAELKEKHGAAPILLRTTYEGRDLYAQSFNEYDVKRCKKTDKGALPSVIVDGPAAGSVTWTKKTSHLSYGGASSRNSGPSPLKDRRAKLKARREQWVIDQVHETLFETRFDELGFAGSKADKLLLRLAATFGTEDMGGNFGHLKHCAGLESAVLWEQVWELVRRNIPCHRMSQAEALAAFLGVDIAALKTTAEHELPEPKSWAGLKEDGTPKSAATRAKERKAAKKKLPPADQFCTDTKCDGETGCTSCPRAKDFNEKKDAEKAKGA